MCSKGLSKVKWIESIEVILKSWVISQRNQNLHNFHMTFTIHDFRYTFQIDFKPIFSLKFSSNPLLKWFMDLFHPKSFIIWIEHLFGRITDSLLIDNLITTLRVKRFDSKNMNLDYIQCIVLNVKKVIGFLKETDWYSNTIMK